MWKHDGRPPPGRRVLITFDDAYQDLADSVFPVLAESGLSALVFVVTGCIGKTNRWDADLGGVHRILTSAEILHWSRRGIEFGAHTREHVDLTRLDSATARDEMAGSKTELEAILGHSVSAFAYPYGSYNASVVAMAASLFDVAFTADEGPNRADVGPHQLRRSMVSTRDTSVEVELRARCGFSPQERTRKWVSGRRTRRRGRTANA